MDVKSKAVGFYVQVWFPGLLGKVVKQHSILQPLGKLRLLGGGLLDLPALILDSDPFDSGIVRD